MSEGTDDRTWTLQMVPPYMLAPEQPPVIPREDGYKNGATVVVCPLERATAAERERDEALDLLERLSTEGCREELGEEQNYHKCGEPAEFILWGKLLSQAALGPRCYDHAARYIAGQGLSSRSGYALVDLRPARALLHRAGRGKPTQ